MSFNLYRTYISFQLVLRLMRPWFTLFPSFSRSALFCRHVPFQKTRGRSFHLPDPPSFSPGLFSLHPSDAILDSSSMLLAAIRIPIQRCQPAFQHSNKNTKRSRPTASFSWKSAALLLIGLSFAPQTAVHALPGTNHAILFNGKPSLDVHHQQRYVETVINNSITASEGSGHFYASPANVPPDPLLTAEPYCFVADTDSFPFVIDTGANWFIVNDRSLFTSFKPQSGLVKGIGGTPVPLSGIGTIRLNLKSGDGFIDAITICDAVYIPTSPFNLLPPQLLIRKLNDLRYECDMASHSDTRYVFTYRKPQGQTSIQRRLTIPIGPNDLFTVRTGEGYTAFFHEVKANAPEWCAFIGDAHIIPDNNKENGLDSPLHLNLERPREPAQQLGKTRELSSLPSEKTRELPNSIPYEEGDFQPIRPGPSEALFDLTGSEQFVDDPVIALNRRKQQRLATYHEQLACQFLPPTTNGQSWTHSQRPCQH
jgi:hypothetical protein